MDNTKLAELFIKEQSSLEILLLLCDEGPMNLDQIVNEKIDSKIIDLLNNLKKLDMVDIKGDLVSLTPYGNYLITKLRKKTTESNI